MPSYYAAYTLTNPCTTGNQASVTSSMPAKQHTDTQAGPQEALGSSKHVEQGVSLGTSVNRFLRGAGRSRLPASVAGFMAASRRKLGWRGTAIMSPLSAMVTLPLLPSSRPAIRSSACTGPHVVYISSDAKIASMEVLRTCGCADSSMKAKHMCVFVGTTRTCGASKVT